jgi:hypothetical protein
MVVARSTLLAAFLALTTACAGVTAGGPQPSGSPSGSGSSGTGGAPRPSSAKLDPAQAERLQRVMVPLLKGMNTPLQPSQVQVGIVDDPAINAANAGGGRFLVTTGLLQKASDDQLRGVLAHELAHEDLNHVAKAQPSSSIRSFRAAAPSRRWPASWSPAATAAAKSTRRTRTAWRSSNGRGTRRTS